MSKKIISKIWREKKIILGLFLVIFLLIALIPIHQAKAGLFDMTISTVGKLVNGILYAITVVAAWLLGAVGKLFDWFFEFEKVSGYSKAILVTEGWKVVRNFTNIFFAFVLMIIAFATILGKETYGMKALLPKLIIVALLINFSLFISGVIVDFGQVFLHYFVDQAKQTGGIGEGKFVSVELANKLGLFDLVQKIPEAEATAAVQGFIPWIIYKIQTAFNDTTITTQQTISLVFAIILLYGAIFIFIGGFILLFYRMMSLWVLMISAPIVWIASIIPYPEISKYWGQWWSSLIKQCLVGPVYFFFVYLTFIFIRTGGWEKISEQAMNAQGGGFLISFASVASIMQYLTILGIMGAGLLVAPALGGAGAAAAMKMASGIRQGAGKWARGAGLAGIAAIGARPGMQAAFKKASDQMSKTWGLRQLAEPTRRMAATLTRKKDIDTKEKEWGPRSTSDIQDGLKAAMGRFDVIEQMALAKILAGRNELSTERGLTDGDIENTIKKAKGYGIDTPMLLNRLDIAKKTLKPEEFKELIIKAKPAELERIRKKDIEEIPEAIEAIKEALISGAWKNSHLKTLAEENPYVRTIVNETIIQQENRPTFAPHIEDYLNSSAGQNLFRGPKKVEITKPKIEIVGEERGPIRGKTEY